MLHRVTYKGAPIVKGKRVTGFTNDEEEAVHLTKVVPFLVEDELKRLGANFEKAPNWQPFSIVDGRLVTGQNPASSTGAAEALAKVSRRGKSRLGDRSNRRTVSFRIFLADAPRVDRNAAISD